MFFILATLIYSVSKFVSRIIITFKKRKICHKHMFITSTNYWQGLSNGGSTGSRRLCLLEVVGGWSWNTGKTLNKIQLCSNLLLLLLNWKWFKFNRFLGIVSVLIIFEAGGGLPQSMSTVLLVCIFTSYWTDIQVIGSSSPLPPPVPDPTKSLALPNILLSSQLRWRLSL